MDAASQSQMDLIVIDDNTPSMQVAKANALVEATYELTLKEHKLLLIAMSQLKRDQTQFFEQVWSVPDLARLMGLSPYGSYREVEKAAAGLMKKQVIIRNGKDWVRYQWVRKAYCVKGQFGIQFSEDLRPYLLGLVARYTMYALSNILKMSSEFAIRFYDHLEMHNSLGRKEKTFSLDPDLTQQQDWDDLSKILNYNRDTYSRVSNLKQRVLKPAVDQILEHTEFTDISYEPIRYKRKVIALKFSWKADDGLADLRNHPLFSELRDFGVGERVIRNLLTQYDEDHIGRTLARVRRLQEKDSTIESPVGYLLSLLKRTKDDAVIKSSDVSGSDQSQSDQVQPSSVPVADTARTSAEMESRAASGAPSNDVNLDDRSGIRDQCASDNEWKRLLQLERRLGVTFETYTDYVLADNETRA